MSVGVGGAGAIAGSLDVIVDEALGIVRRLDAVHDDFGVEKFYHFEAQLCDTRALGGQECQPGTTAVALDRQSASIAATASAIALYAGALYSRGALSLTSFSQAEFPCVRPSDFALFSDAQYARPGFPYVPAKDDTPLRWVEVLDLETDKTMSVPAAFVYHPFPYFRRDGDKPIAPPAGTGLVCAEGIVEAALAGLAEVIRQDAMAQFWQAMTMPPEVIRETLPARLQETIGVFEGGGDHVIVLDITTDNLVPAFVVTLRSDHPERPAFVFGAGADLGTETAIAKALMDLAGARRRSLDAMRDRVPPSPENAWKDMDDPVDHLHIAAEHQNRSHFDFAFSSDIRLDFSSYESRRTGAADADLETMVRLVSTTGHRVCFADLTSEDIADFGIAAGRTLVPGYLPLGATYSLRALGGSRLYEVPQRLGYRGIRPSGADNPLPHPFAI